METQHSVPDHLTSEAAAAYLDKALTPADRSRIEAHLVDCAECRNELIEVTQLLRTRPHRGRWVLPLGAAAAAAVLLLVLLPRQREYPEPGSREPAVTTTVAPVAVAPSGTVASAGELVWTAVPHADRYRLTLFDSAGTVLWERQTGDTAASLPDTLRLKRGAPYLWKVEAQTGVNRWVSSELVLFSVGPPRP
ncbi:MAG TPA: zf-HC2 domain-containing protein [Gemmatimonadales bacterium]|nr:zf-HC2 domain-containing protein [Gemmatimonadales bacterium]